MRRFTNMKQDEGSSDENASPLGQPINQNECAVRLDLIIQKHLGKPKAASDAKLQKWHNEYKMADGNLMNRRHPTIEEVQSDELDKDAVGKCIAELAKEIVVDNRFCRDCQHLFDNWPDVSDPRTQSKIVRECHTLVLEAAGLKGCRCCAFMMQILKDSELLDIFRKLEARLECLNDNARVCLSLSFEGWQQNKMWINFPGKICTTSYSVVAAEASFVWEVSELNTGTYDDERDVFEIVNAWTKRCSESHMDCKREEQAILPTRLIYIGTNAPRLVLTKGLDKRPRYSTLSYAWGKPEFIKLTTKTYNSFLSMIPPQELPKTFKDAIHISRRLGLEYIWIDALCIIQGDVEDWRRESSLMSAVYSGSFVNIAASSATNVREGCFLQAPGSVQGFKASVSVNGIKSRQSVCIPYIYGRSVTESHLATRAWALQEKILPSRTIHFGNRGAFWECKTMIANEYFPDGLDDKYKLGLVNVCDSQENAEKRWTKILYQYSAANLTYGRDRLPAISGIARSIYKEMGGGYLAGLWRKRIEAQLCWQTWTPQKRPPWRAPSWSWASVDSKACYSLRTDSDPMENSYAHVLGAKMMCIDQNPFGEVCGGRLRIGCSGMLAARFTGSSMVKVENNQDSVDADVDYEVSPDCLDDEYLDGDGKVYMLPVLGGTLQVGRADMMVSGILLSKAAGKAGYFYRIGQFQYYIDHNEPGWSALYYSFIKAFKQGAAAVAEGICAEVIENSEYPEERYVIYLV